MAVAPRAAHAGEGPTFALDIHGDYRIRAAWLSDLPVDANGTALGQRAYGEHRVRVDPRLAAGPFVLHASLDLFDGVVAGDPTIDFGLARRPRDSVRPIPGGDVRFLYAVYNSPIGRVQAGLQGSRWGLGLLASDGGGVGDDFGDELYGDRSVRLLFATRPIKLATGGKSGAPLVAALAADLVIEDETARWGDGDRSFQGVLAVLWSEGADGKPPEEGAEATRELGAYVVYRTLRDGAGGKLGALAVDLYGSLRAKLGATTLTVAAEGVLLAGHTTLARSLTAPDGHGILAAGAVARATLAAAHLDGVLEIGWASGDRTSEDDHIGSLKFDPDYNVGLLMFEEALAWQSARSADLASDPDVVGKPPNGVRLLPTNGSITNAVYVNPRVRARVGDRVLLVGGLLWAIAPLPVADPYNTFRTGGGDGAGYLGGPAGRSYGVEVDAAARLFVDAKRRSFWAIEGGVLFPGNVFARPDGSKMGPQGEVLLRLWLGW